MKWNLWDLMPRFTLQCWSFRVVMMVANSIGHFILVEEAETLVVADKRLPRVLVEVDISERILVEVEVIWNEGYFTQKLDY